VSQERNKKGDQTQRTRGGGLVAVVSRERKQKGDQTERTTSDGRLAVVGCVQLFGVLAWFWPWRERTRGQESVPCYVYIKWM
jgi:hypothetical protein